MAGDWIKVEHATPDKPEVLQIAAALGVADPDMITGKLVRLFIWADQQTIDGNAVGVTLPFLDYITRCPGFGQALTETSWISIEPDGHIRFNHFDRHNGETAKQRALTAKRVAHHRAQISVEHEKPTKNGTFHKQPGRNAPVVTKSLPEKRDSISSKKLNPPREERAAAAGDISASPGGTALPQDQHAPDAPLVRPEDIAAIKAASFADPSPFSLRRQQRKKAIRA